MRLPCVRAARRNSAGELQHADRAAIHAAKASSRREGLRHSGWTLGIAATHALAATTLDDLFRVLTRNRRRNLSEQLGLPERVAGGLDPAGDRHARGA